MITRSKIKRLLDFNPNTSRLRANEAALAVSKSGVIEVCHIKSPVLLELSLNGCIFLYLQLVSGIIKSTSDD